MKRVADVPLEVLEFEGKFYSTLDFCPPDAADFLNKSMNYHLLRPGWSIAPHSDDLRDTVLRHKWGGADWLLVERGAYSLKGDVHKTTDCIDRYRWAERYFKGVSDRTSGLLNSCSRILIVSGKQHTSGACEHTYTEEMTSNLFKRRRFTDFVITCEGQEFPCHRAILAEASSFFEAAVSGSTAEAKSGRLEIHGAEAEDVSTMLSFMYTGSLSREDKPKDASNHLKIASLGNRYGFDKMVAACTPVLLQKLSVDTVSPIARVLKVGADNPVLKPCFNAFLDAVRSDPALLEALVRAA
jgi:hypothetical protein